MDLLPFELYPPIFRHLNFCDLFRVRAVCRKLNLAVKNFKIRELFLYDSMYTRPSEGNWSHTGRPYDLGYSIGDSAWCNQFKCLMDFRFLRKLKSFYLYEDINELKKLEHLEIRAEYGCGGSWTIGCSMKLALPELKAFDLYSNYDEFPLELETPKLEDVTINGLSIDSIKFNYPLAVTHLRTSHYDEKMAIFKNLELFEFHFKDLSADFLTNFSKLKVLKIATKIPNLAEFMRKRDIANLRIYYLGIEHLVGDELDGEREFSLERMSADRKINRMPFYLKYYASLDDDLPNCPELCYDDLLKAMPEIPGDFFRKFNNIQTIKISTKVENASRLLEFISGCQNLSELTLTNTTLCQAFYDRLPSVSSLCYLSVFEDSELRLEFGFLTSMKRLKTFKTDQELHLTAQLALDSLRYLHTFIFKIDGQTFSVRRSDIKGKYVLESSLREFPRRSTFSELLRWCDHVKKTAERSKKRVEAWKNGPQFKKTKIVRT